MTNKTIFYYIFFLFSFLASAIKCWRCSSDASNAAFCNDPFDASIISDQQRRWSYVECTYPPGQLNPYSQASNQRAVCKKVKQLGKFSSQYSINQNNITNLFKLIRKNGMWRIWWYLNGRCSIDGYTIIVVLIFREMLLLSFGILFAHVIHTLCPISTQNSIQMRR